MKRFVGLVVGLLLVFTLTACDNVYIEPGVIAVQYENIRYEGDSIVVDVWITNGTDSDYAFDYVEFWLELPETVVEANSLSAEEVEVCGAGFYFDENVSTDGYVMYEIEFTTEYIFITDTGLDGFGVVLNDLELYYWFEE